MKLDDWLIAKVERRSAFAARLGTSAGYVTDLCQSGVRPSLKMAQRIMIATGGAVRPEDFFVELEPPEAAPMTLTKNEYALLQAIDAHGGYTTADVSSRCGIRYAQDNRRLRSAAMRSWLMALKRQGFVRYLDDQKPVCWVRTEAGTAAIIGERAP